jgi:hypothetical protein
MSNPDWRVLAVGVSAAVIATLSTVARATRRRPRKQATAAALGETRIEIVFTEDGGDQPSQPKPLRTETTEERS